jgi:hypothetical protein
MRRITAVPGITSEQRTIAKIFLAIAAELTVSAGLTQPRHADAATNSKRSDTIADHIDAADNFVAGYEREPGIWQFAIDNMQVGAAHAARRDANSHLTVSWPRIGPLHK